MSNPKISVIVPVYNAESTIRRCVDSILAQTFTDFECLLIDDGSKDRSGAICDEYAEKDSRVRAFHKENGGVSSARNVGLDNVNGDWVTFCDSDDSMVVNALESYIKYIHPDISIIRAGYRTISSEKTKDVSCKEFTLLDCDSNIFSFIEKTHYYGFLWNSLFSKSVIANIHFDESISWSEDHIFSAMADYNCKRIAFIPNVVYIHYMHEEGSLSSPKDPYMLHRAANLELQAKRRLYDRDGLPISNFCMVIYRDVLLWSLKVAFLYLDRKGQKRYLDYFSDHSIYDNRLGRLLWCLQLKQMPFFVKCFLWKWMVYAKR